MGFKTDQDRQTYLDTLRDTGSVVKARKVARTSLASVRKAREEDEEFAQAEQEMIEEADDALEQEARRRAIEGDREPVYDKDGKLVGHRTKRSDTLLIFMMKGARTLNDRYADRSKQEITGRNGEPLGGVFDETAAAARIASILEAAKTRKAGE